MSVFVNIRGLKLKIKQRKALDVIRLAEYVRRNSESQDPPNQVFQYAMIVSDSLKLNANDLPWWRVITKWRIKRAVKIRNIAASFSLSELADMTKEVLIVEGLSETEFEALKKKVTEMDEM